MTPDEDRGLAWQIGVWDDMAEVYVREIDRRFAPIVDHVLTRAELRPDQRVLDLGPGTGSVALASASRRAWWPCARSGHKLRDAGAGPQAASGAALTNLSFRRSGRGNAGGRVEPGHGSGVAHPDVIDRATAAREIARVLQPGSRLVAAVWDAVHRRRARDLRAGRPSRTPRKTTSR